MGTKTISIMDDAYNLLRALKSKDESFSDEIRRIASSREGIMDLAGAWNDLSKEEAENIKKSIRKMRETGRLASLFKEKK
ncbi:antitoxin VapB family protein [Candidatus Woesearchaeota archaeon]|nr:antitoxin VapB family protein [Candidatus Woesearchaeota archaeon]